MAESNEHEDRNLVLYFLVAFAWSWLFWLPIVLGNLPVLQSSANYVLLLLGGFGPSVSAFALTYHNEGQNGLKKLLKRGIDHRFDKMWLIPLFLLFPLTLGSAFLLGTLIEEVTLDLVWLSTPLLLIFPFIAYFFIAGGTPEEFGWRGYALDRLQVHYNAFVSSLILGLIWGFWHLPMFFMNGTPTQGVPFWGYLPLIILLAILFTWLHNNTNGSVFVAITFHMMFNVTFLVLFPILKFGFYSLPILYGYILLLTFAAIIIIHKSKDWFEKKHGIY